jgi:hypothetical protein
MHKDEQTTVKNAVSQELCDVKAGSDEVQHPLGGGKKLTLHVSSDFTGVSHLNLTR